MKHTKVNILTFEEGESLLEDDFDYLPYEITHIFIENNSLLGVAYLVEDKEIETLYIENIDAAKEGVGYGRKMINALKMLDGFEKIEGVSGDAVKGFWEKMGALFFDYNTTLEGYEFIIRK